MKKKFNKIACIADLESESAVLAYNSIKHKYNLIDLYSNTPEYYDAVITIGGDGIMLKALHYIIGHNVPIFGMNKGSIGFLLNEYSENSLHERLEQAHITTLHPIEMRAIDSSGASSVALAVNEVSLLRATSQSAKICIYINEIKMLDQLVADGVLVSTPAGSTAYNFAAYGPIIPINSNILAMTPISPFRPRRWRGALIPHNSIIQFEVLESEKRPVNAVADSIEFKNILSVEIRERSDITLSLLFEKQNMLHEKILREQFYC